MLNHYMLSKMAKGAARALPYMQSNTTHHSIIKSEKPSRIKVKDKMYYVNQYMA